MRSGTLRAIRTYGTAANVRACLTDFAHRGGGIASSFVPAAQHRLIAGGTETESVQAVPLDRIVAGFLTAAGLPMLPLADGIQEREALALACRSLAPESPFYASREFAGFVRRLQATLRELRLWRITPRRLRRAAENAEPWLSGKLQSLADLEVALRAGLDAAAREMETDRLERCLGYEEELAPSRSLFLYSGGEYAPLWADWIRWLLKQGIDVTLVLDGHASAAGIFQGADRLLADLEVKAGFEGETCALARSLFSDQAELEPGLDVRILSAGDPLGEVEWALRAIREEVEAGMPLEQASIYARNLADYAPLLESASERFEIPLRIARRETLANNGWVRFFLAYLAACGQDRPAGLGPLAAGSYVGLDHEVANLHDSTIQLASSAEDPWGDLRVRLSQEIAADRWLLEAVRLHSKAEMDPISFAEWFAEFESIAEAPWLQGEGSAESPTAARDRAARSALFHALDQRASFAEAAGEEWSFLNVVSEVRRLAEQNDYGWSDPQQGVAVASTAYALGSPQVLCILGMVEGSFPRRRAEDPILSDAERSALAELIPKRAALRLSHDVARGERDELVRLCASPGRSLLLYYPRSGEERENTPAFYLTEVARAAGAASRSIALPSARLAPPAEECLFAADQALRSVLDAPKVFPREPALALEEVQSALGGMPEEGLTPGELRDAATCTFKYVFRRRLGLHSGHQAPAYYRLRRLPEAIRLSHAGSDEEAERTLIAALEAEIEEQADLLTPHERRLMDSGGRREIRGWIEREFVAREIWRKDEETYQGEVEFGQHGTANLLPYPGGTIKIRGRFAAVGDLGDYAIGQVYGYRLPSSANDIQKLNAPEFLELGVQLWSLAKRKRSVGLEVDTPSGERILALLPKPETADLESRVSLGLRVLDLGEKKAFFERVKKILEQTAKRIESGELRPSPGDWCARCELGEICRWAQGYGEQPDLFAGENPDVD